MIALEPPIPMPSPSYSKQSRITKFFAWMTAMLLSASVLLSLFTTISDNNDLKNQLDHQDAVTVCRSEANNAVFVALSEVNILVGEQNFALGDVVLDRYQQPVGNEVSPGLIDTVSLSNDRLQVATEELREALDLQAESIVYCRNRD